MRVPNSTSLRRLLALGETEIFDGPPANGSDARAVIDAIDKIDQARQLAPRPSERKT